MLALDKEFAPCRVEGREHARCGVRGRGVTAAHAACMGDRARAERTWNMFRLSVTLDVSKLSAWLNADAYCRVERGAAGRGIRPGRREGVGWR